MPPDILSETHSIIINPNFQRLAMHFMSNQEKFLNCILKIDKLLQGKQFIRKY